MKYISYNKHVIHKNILIIFINLLFTCITDREKLHWDIIIEKKNEKSIRLSVF